MPEVQVSVGQATALSESLTSANASCASVFNGSITVAASGGTPPYQYSVNYGPNQTSNVITGLQAGNNYIVSIIDNHGCIDTSSIGIDTSYAVTIDTVSTSDISCYGAGNGSLTVVLSGGISPYQYSIDGNSYQNSGTFSGLSAGHYTAIGRDSKGCSESIDVTISQPSPLSVTIDSLQNASCGSVSNGAIYVTANGGTPGYTYHWNNGATTESDTGISSGTYNLTVTDSRGCTVSSGASITQPFTLSLNIALFTNPACNGDSSGQVLATANGGVPPYSYLWSNGATTQDIDSVPAGAYTLNVTDAGGCQASISQSLTNPPTLVLSDSSSNVTCHGASNGFASVTATGGVPPYVYEWSDFQGTAAISGIPGGEYYIVVADHNGCRKTDSVFVSEPTALVVLDTVIPITCNNDSNGKVNVGVSGGTSPYTYLWSTGATTADISGIGGGTVTLTVTDANLCTAVVSDNLINPAPIAPNFDIQNVLCYATNGVQDSTGSITASPTGGNPGYTYLWSNGGTTKEITNLPADSGGTIYIVTITDMSGCASVDTAKLRSPGALTVSGFALSVTCFNDRNGFIYTSAYGGVPPYNYQWTSGSNAQTQNLDSLSPGTYTLRVTDANGCPAQSAYIVFNPTQLTASISETDNSCFGSCDGSVTALPVGGVPPYSYLWSNFSTDSIQTSVCAGQYSLLLTDSNGCHLVDTTTVHQPTQVQIAGTVTGVTCNGFQTGAITLTVSGGAAPYSYKWSNGPTSQNLTGLAAGNYSVTVSDAHNCSQTASFTVTESQGLHTNISISDPRCAGGNDGFVSVVVTGGTIPYSYRWSTSNVQAGATATNLSAGSYTLTVTDSVNCSATVTASVLDPSAVIVTTNFTGSRCANNPTGSVKANVTGGFPPYRYMLNGYLQNTDSFSHLAPGNYAMLVFDANGCQGTDSFFIPSHNTIGVTLSATDYDILTGMKTQLSAVATSDTTILHYIWSPVTIDTVDVFNYSNCSDTSDCSTPYVSPPFTTQFLVTVMDADSCFASDSVTIIVKEDDVVFFPTAFTPNGDGLNDRFEFDILGASTIEISIFDRWGERVYYNSNQTNGFSANDGWDGTKGGKQAPEDTYVYQMKVTYFDGTVKNRTGTIAIMR